MEGVATTAYTGFRSYWRRKGYRRLSNRTDPNHRLRTEQQKQPNSKRGRFSIPKPKTKIKLGRFRFRLGLGSVRRFVLKIRDAYVNAMLGSASKGMIYGAGGGATDGGTSGFGGKGHVKEYDEKLLVEIYERMVLARQQQGGGRRVASVSSIHSLNEVFPDF